jgi:outer membrane protein insertion porin family
LASGTAFRGAGQTLRLEAVPGSQFKRYTASFAEPNLFGYLPISFGLSGFLYDRRYQDYDEERLGGRISFGYRVTPDLSLSTGINGQNVEVSNPRVNTVQELNDVLGDTQLYTGEVRLTHDTRNSPFQPSEGHFFEFGYEKAFGDFDYSRFEIENRNYLLIAERADGSGKQTLSLSTRLGFSGEETPLYENYFAGGYSTMRGFDFRGASPTDQGVQVGGRFQWLNTLEYMFPITADDAFRGVAFCDFGTVERDIELNRDNFRVAPGLGLRISIPLLGPAPLAFDFAYPVSMAATDDRRIFSFYMSTLR